MVLPLHRPRSVPRRYFSDSSSSVFVLNLRMRGDVKMTEISIRASISRIDCVPILTRIAHGPALATRRNVPAWRLVI